jgi:hypothetical protein
MQEQHGWTYTLNGEDRGRDWSAFSVWERHSGTYTLNIEDGARDQLVFSMRE